MVSRLPVRVGQFNINKSHFMFVINVKQSKHSHTVHKCCVGRTYDWFSEVKIVFLFGHWGKHVVPE